MPPNSLPYHLAASFAIALAFGCAWPAIRRDSGAFLAGVAAFLAAVTLGVSKEMFDLLVNPWSLAVARLRLDSALDMAWNASGALAGSVLAAAIIIVLRGIPFPGRARAVPARMEAPSRSRPGLGSA